jgi:hypothetical protein
MPRKQVTRLRKDCDRITGHLWAQAERAADAAYQLVRPWLPEELESADILHFMLCVGERLDAIRDSLTASDNQHNHKLFVDRGLREERDSANADLRQHGLQLRDSLDGLFGRGGGSKIFEDAPSIPTDPVALHQFIGHVIDNLADEDFPMPEPLQSGFSLDREAAIRDLRGPHDRLGKALKKLKSTESESKYSQSHKDSEVAQARIFVGKADRFLESFFDLIGLDGLSDRVRPSSRRASGGDPTDPTGDEPDVDTAPLAVPQVDVEALDDSDLESQPD